MNHRQRFTKYASFMYTDTIFINEDFTSRLKKEVRNQGDAIGIFVYSGFAFVYMASTVRNLLAPADAPKALESLSVCAKGFLTESHDRAFAIALSDISTVEWLDELTVKIGFYREGAFLSETLKASEKGQFRMVGFVSNEGARDNAEAGDEASFSEDEITQVV